MPIPSEEGHFWWRPNHDDHRWALIEVEERDGELHCLLIVNDDDGHPALEVTQTPFYRGQWGGPASPPDHCDAPYRIGTFNIATEDGDDPAGIANPCPDCDGYWMCDPSGQARFCKTCEGRGYVLTTTGENHIIDLAKTVEIQPPSGHGNDIDALARHWTREAAAKIQERRREDGV